LGINWTVEEAFGSTRGSVGSLTCTGTLCGRKPSAENVTVKPPPPVGTVMAHGV
jgi:hypothetical protein